MCFADRKILFEFSLLRLRVELKASVGLLGSVQAWRENISSKYGPAWSHIDWAGTA